MDSEEDREGGNRMGNERGAINEKKKKTLADRPSNNFERKEMKRKQKEQNKKENKEMTTLKRNP